ncbi:MAG: translocation/assembly module TamB domain-containing protein, partial [Candidatus Eisenbacteria bacterium]
LLTYGQLQNNATAALGQVGVGYLARQLAREVPELEQYLGVVELGTTQDQNNGTTTAPIESKAYYTVGVSRYFTRDLLLRYSQVVGDLTEAQSVEFQDLAAEFRINRLLYLSGQVTRRRGVLVTAQDQTLYNVEVRARYEY